MRSIFTLDLRSLALFRVLLGSMIIIDLVQRVLNLSAHYSDWGVLPRSVLLAESELSIWSLHFLNGHVVYQFLLFAIAFACAICLVLGLRTQSMLFISWLLMISLHNRNPFVLNAGDDILRIMLFFSLFLPLGARYSLDALLAPKFNTASNDHFSWGSIAFISQLGLVYTISAVEKSDPRWHSEGTAIEYALNLDMFVNPIGQWLLQFPEVLRIITPSVWWLEAVGPFLLFLAPISSFFRYLVILAFCSFHIGLIITFYLGLFPYIACICWLTLLPKTFWEFVGTPREINWSPNLLLLSERYAKAPRPSKFAWLAALALVLATAMNIAQAFSIEQTTARFIRTQLTSIAKVIRLDQNWALFAPKPLEVDHWFVAEGVTFNDEKINAVTLDGSIDFGNIESLTATIPMQRWRKYIVTLLDSPQSRQEAYLNYLCRRSQAQANPMLKLKSIEFSVLKQRTDLAEKAPITRQIIKKHSCYPRG